MTDNHIGEIIRLCRKRKGWTQRQLSRISGVSVSVISSAETGKHEPRYFIYMTLLNALGFDLRIVELEEDAKKT